MIERGENGSFRPGGAMRVAGDRVYAFLPAQKN
jgi:hypothetical protein